MDPSGKLIYTKNQEVLSANLQTMQDDTTPEGTRIPISIKEMGSTEIFATALIHSPNGRFVTVVGDGEYIIYTALAWRNKSFGNGVSFAWANDSNTYAVLESRVKLRVYKNFKERGGAGMKGSGSWTIEGLHGGPLLCARGHGFVLFWDWETGDIIRRIDVEAKNVGAKTFSACSSTHICGQVLWSGSGSLVAIVAEDSFYILRFDRDAYTTRLEESVEITDEGVEEAFDVVAEVPDV
jgi:coatomer subunit beta'